MLAARLVGWVELFETHRLNARTYVVDRLLLL
jgi:hypothetical protein